jgi:NAD(P)-dependent dehydrogenase (short-subunit alcohol dehydrogenase family)
MLANKLCLITGGIGAIGFEIAKKFAKEGASIALVDLHSHAKQAIKELDLISGSQIHSYHKCDVSKKQEILNVFESIRDFHSANYLPKVLVNNAGVYINKLIQDQDEEDINQILDVNLKGTILMTQEFVRHLLRNIKHKKCGPLETYASIVNISSLSGKNGCTEESPYSASKAGVEGFTRSMAKELGQYQIRCNAILPGKTI